MICITSILRVVLYTRALRIMGCLLVAVAAPSIVYAQQHPFHPGCPDSTWTPVTDSFKVRFNNQCCQVRVHGCIRQGVVRVMSVDFTGDCWDIYPGGPTVDYDKIINRGFEVLLLRNSSLIIPPPEVQIPNCPETSSWVIQRVSGSCGTLIQMPEIREVNGVAMQVMVDVFFPCNAIDCLQTCHACVSQTVDECNPEVPVLYYACENKPSPAPCPPEGCKIPSCIPLPTQ